MKKAIDYGSDDNCFYVKDTNGTSVKYISESAINKMILGYLAEYGVIPSFVDLGLPSGTLWCEYNIGASTPYEAGLYFAWGEISGYTAAQVGVDKSFNSDWSDYQFGNPPSKYNETDGKSTLDDVDNAAKDQFGNAYTIPTKAQFDELYTNTTYAFTQLNGVNGLLLTSTANTNTIFFPAAGDGYDGNVRTVGNAGNYWTSSLYSNYVLYAFYLGFESGGNYYFSINERFYGLSVRPVISQNQ